MWWANFDRSSVKKRRCLLRGMKLFPRCVRRRARIAIKCWAIIGGGLSAFPYGNQHCWCVPCVDWVGSFIHLWVFAEFERNCYGFIFPSATKEDLKMKKLWNKTSIIISTQVTPKKEIRVLPLATLLILRSSSHIVLAKKEVLRQAGLR